MAVEAKLKDFLKNEVEKRILGSNVFFGFILVLLEKLVELEFACPCNSKHNAAFGSAFLILPGILSFVLMMCIQGCKCEKSVLQCFIPLIVWVTLTFLDGQYFACAMTGWSGSYQTAPQSSHLKWCKPDNTSHKTSEDLLRTTQRWFFISQGIGMVFILAAVVCIPIIIGICFMIKKCSKQNNNHPETNANDANADADADADADANADADADANANGHELSSFL